MKMKVKALAAALPLLAAVQANAAINSDNAASGLGYGAGNGELFLSVIDRGGNNPESYVRDLGSLGLTKDILANPSLLVGTSIGPDSNLSALLANQASQGGDIYWQVSGINNSGPPNPLNVGALTTSSTTLTPSNVPAGFGGMGASFNSASNYINAVNAAADPANLTDYAANNSVVIPSTNTGAFYDGSNWGKDWLNPANTEAAIGQTMGFYYVQVATNTTSAVTPFPSGFTLGQDGTLTYAPLPPAVWLLGSALVGLVGVGRRRTTAAV